MSQTPHKAAAPADGNPRKPGNGIGPRPTKANRKERREVPLSWLLLTGGFGAMITLGQLF